jgi:pyruvate dehydrogenase E1 component beta subunit
MTAVDTTTATDPSVATSQAPQADRAAAPSRTTLTMAKALNAGLRRALDADPKVMLMGEDVGKLGGVFRVTDGLQATFGPDRVMDTPLAESGILGTAVGLALRGYRPVCEIQFDGFVYPAFDQIVSQVAKMRFRSAGRLAMPIVVRIPYGGGIGAVEHHSESPETYFVHTAGLRVVSPATAGDAYWMIQQAIAADDPVIFLEPKRRYWDKVDVEVDGQPPRALWDAHVVRPGSDATLVGYGPTVAVCLDAAEVAAEEGRDVEVIDLRSLSPIDWATLTDAARRTGRMVVVHEAPLTLGLGAEIAARVTERCFTSLEAPILRVTGFDTPYPPSRMEDLWLPDLDRVLDAVDTVLLE